MIRTLTFLIMAGTVACSSSEQIDVFPKGDWIDLSHDFSDQTIYWPTAKPFALEVVSAQQTAAGYYYAANNFSAAEHGGTHLDAPVHFAEGQWTTDQIPIERLVGAAVVIDVQSGADSSPDYRIGPAAIAGWEQEHGVIPSGSIILFHTGWGRRWPDRARYLGTSQTGPKAVADLHFPGIDSAAAQLLVKRKVKAVGIDTPSIDYGQSTSFPAHRVLFASNIPAFENVANLHRLPLRGSFVLALPMKIKNGSGGPLRVVALVP